MLPRRCIWSVLFCGSRLTGRLRLLDRIVGPSSAGLRVGRTRLRQGGDVVHARWLVEWLPDKRLALRRMMSALRPGGVLLVEEPDFVTIYGAGEAAVRRVFIAAMAHLESVCPVEVEYGRRVLGDLAAVGLAGVQAEGRCPVVRGGSPLAADFPAADHRETA